MTTIEVEIPKEIEQSFLEGKKRMSYDAFLKKVEEVEEANWVDANIDKPIPVKDFADMLRKDIYGS